MYKVIFGGVYKVKFLRVYKGIVLSGKCYANRPARNPRIFAFLLTKVDANRGS